MNRILVIFRTDLELHEGGVDGGDIGLEEEKEKYINSRIDKEKKIKNEEKNFKSFFKKLDKNKLKLIENLIKKASFMEVTLTDLQNTMNVDGVVSEYMNGANQFGTKKSPEVEVYNTMLKNYTVVIKQLCEFLPDNNNKDNNEGNKLLSFAMQKKVK